MTLADWSHRQAKALLFVTLVLAIAGGFLATGLPVSLFPRVNFPRIVVNAEAGDMPVEEMVASVTRPLEEVVNSVPGVVSVRSTTSRGAADLSINCDWHANMDQTLLLVQSRLDQARSQLPAGTSLTTRRMDPTVFPVIAYSLTSKTRSPEELRAIALYTLRPILGRVPGVAQIDVLGGQTPEALVEVNPAKLQARHLSTQQIATALQTRNQVSAVGRLEENYRLDLALVDGRFRSQDEIANTVVSTSHGIPVTLGEVASVKPSTAPQWVHITANGTDAVLVNVIQQPGGNTVAIDSAIEERLRELRSQLPPGVTITQYYNQANLVRESMASVQDSILVGIVLGAFVLFLFLRDVRVTLIALASVPLTIALTVLLLRAFGQGFNIMTLGGIAAAVGLILDDAIVMVESISHHRQAGAGSALEATRRALKEQWKPFVGSSLTSTIVFLPLAFLTGVTGAFFKSLSLTMASALVVSLALALLVVPLLAGRFGHGASTQAYPAGPTRLGSLYERVMRVLFARPWIVAVVSIAMLAGSYGLYRTLPNGFLPSMDEGAFVVDYVTAPGTALSETDRQLKKLEGIIARLPEVASYSRRTGAQMGGALTEPNQGDILVRLKPAPRRSADEIIGGLRTEAESSLPGMRLEFTQLMEDLIGDLTAVPQPIELKVFGSDPAVLSRVAADIADGLPKVPGVVDVFNGTTIAGPSLRFQLDPISAGRFGVSTDGIKDALDAALGGIVPTQMLSGDHMIGVRVRYPEIARSDVAALASVQVPTPAGHTVSVGQLATPVLSPGEAEQTRENVKPMVAVTARIEGQSLGGTIDRIKDLMDRTVKLPPGVYVEYGGLYHEQQDSFRGLAVAIATAFLLVGAVLLFMFRSFAAVVAIAVVDALCTLGILGALGITRTPLNISSMMGTVMIVGIVAENAIFLLHAIHERRSAGLELEAALIGGAASRARAIAMTTLAAVLALLPLALGLGAGAQMQRPLAVAVIGGFSLSSVLLLFVLPVIYGHLLGLRRQL